jgi:hypothetical protein
MGHWSFDFNVQVSSRGRKASLAPFCSDAGRPQSNPPWTLVFAPMINEWYKEGAPW